MSLILEALKKSEAERHLGETPHLGTLPVWSPKTETRSIGWAVLVLVLVVAAAAWHNRDLLGGSRLAEADDDLVSTSKGAPSPGPIKPPTPANPTDHGILVRPQTLAAGAKKPQHHAAEPQVVVATDHRPAKPSAAPLPLPAPQALPTVGDPAASTFNKADRLTVPTPPPQPFAAASNPEKSDRPATPATAPAEHQPAATAAEPTSNAATPLPPTAPAAGTASAPASPIDATGAAAIPLIYDLTLGQRQGLPALRMSMHVYHRDSARRFVIIDGQRVNEDGVLGNQLWVREIRPEGAVLEYRSLRFLLPRVGG